MYVHKIYEGIWKCSECETIVNGKPGKCKNDKKNCSVFKFCEIKRKTVKHIKKKQKLFYIHNGVGFVDDIEA